MIQILVVEDNEHKQSNIKQIILDNSNIKENDLQIVSCIKEAKKLLYEHYYDLLILDLVLPIETGLEASAKNGVQFLEDIHSSPMIKPPIHIVGLSGFSDMVAEYHEQFSKKLWNLIDYRADSTAWHDQLKTIIFHLVKTRQRFIQSSVKKHSYDVAIITALPHPEFEAILRLNNGKWEPVEVENDFIKYYKSTFVEGGTIKTIIAATADQMGMTAASHLSTKMILYFKPKYLIMSGIAAGIKDRGLGYGDILVAEQSWDYGSGKIIEMDKKNESELSDIKFLPDTRDIQLSADLKAKISNFKLSRGMILDKIQNEWQGDSPSTKLQLHLGPIGSGSYVISSELTLKDIKEHQRKLLGIEMETFGVYYAAEHSPEPKTKAISIKSVSDYGDGTKNDKFQKYAAYTSANFIYQFIMTEL
ncbi:phosphorylase family protein [Confluentibacter lentus]|uniref:phosphorylase family protein n=1 Tax=Confluentibacter lentus TaxID=1699412 RepID=UPI000C29095E|nr:response regulator [Confluentibacter lentus]